PRSPIQCARVMRNVGGAGGVPSAKKAGFVSFTALANSRILPSSTRIVDSGPHTPISVRSISAIPRPPSEIDELRDELAVPGGIAEGPLGALRALEVEVHVVLPREADPTVDLDALARGVAVRIRAVGLGHRSRQRRLGDVVRDRPRRVVGDRLRA